MSLVDWSETKKSQFIYNWLKIGAFLPNFDKIYFLCEHSYPLYDAMLKRIENLQFVQSVRFQYINSLKNNGTKYLWIFDDSCERICYSKAFLDFATARRHRGLSTIYIKHNLFHQSKLGGDVVLQNTQIVLFKSPRDVSTLSAQLSFGSELLNWHREATSLLYGHLLIDLSPQTDDRLRYCTNTGSIPLKFYFPNRLKQWIFLDEEDKTSLHSPSVPICFSQLQKCLPSVSPKRVYQVPLRKYCNCSQRKPAKFLPLPSLTICLDMEQCVLIPACVYNNTDLNTLAVAKQELPKYQPEQNTMYQTDSLKMETNKKLFATKADSLVDKSLSCPRINLSKLRTSKLDSEETGILMSDFVQQLRHKNADVPDIYFTLFDAAGLSPTLFLKQNAQAKERGSRAPSKIWTSEAAKAVYAGRCCLWVSTQFSES